MSLMSKLFMLAGLAQNLQGPSITDRVLQPSIKKTRCEMAFKLTRLKSSRTGFEYDCRYPDYRALERNKYAPWGRGELSGLPL